MASIHRVLGAALTLILFSGCTAAATAPPATTPASTEAATTSAPESSAAAPAGDAGIDDFVSKLSTAMSGVKTYSFDITMDTTAMGTEMAMKTKGVVDQTDPAKKLMSLDANIAGMAIKMLQVDGEMYIQMQVLGDKWMVVPEDQQSTYTQAAESGDIASSFAQSKDAIKSVEVVGDESVDGVATKHYLVTYDGSALPNLTGGSGQIVGDSIAYNMWVDSDWLIRKVAMDATASAEGEEVPFKMSGTMGAYNEPVTIKAPSKDDITEMPS